MWGKSHVSQTAGFHGIFPPGRSPVATPLDTIIKEITEIIAINGICCVKLCTNKIKALSHPISKFSFLTIVLVINPV
jgi:hypothetical protein